MNETKPTIAVLSVVVAGALVVGGWLAVPALQVNDASVQAEASRLLERARRTLNAYDPSLTYKSLQVAELNADDVSADPDDLSDALSDEYQQAHEAMWSAYPPTDWDRDNPSPDRANYGNIAGQIREGNRERERLAKENDQRLSEAMRAVDEALAVTKGNASARNDSEANRLKAVIDYHTGLATWAAARMKRQEADTYRRELVRIATKAGASKGAGSLVQDSHIDDEINRLQAQITEAQNADHQDADEMAQLDRKIEGLQTYHDQAMARADDARNRMDALRSKGIDFNDRNAVDSFQQEMESLSKAFGDASREVHAIEYGSFSDAKLDRPGDYLHGRYVVAGTNQQPTVGLGLTHYRDARAEIEARMNGRKGVLDDLHSALERLEGRKQEYAATQEQSVKDLDEAAKAASEAYANLVSVDEEAVALEDRALQSLDQAARVAQQASGYEAEWVNRAREKVSALSGDAAQRSPFQARMSDGWMKGYMAIEEADARLVQAWIHYDQYRAAQRTLEAVKLASASLKIADADPTADEELVKEAREAGIEAVTRARSVLDRNHRDVGDHWTVAAQAAGTTYLMALFGDKAYRADAITGYRNAVQGRENQPFASPFLERLARLEGK